jgi:hypothetical protein
LTTRKSTSRPTVRGADYFSIHNADGSNREIAGRMALTDDNAARAFGKAMIRIVSHRSIPTLELAIVFRRAALGVSNGRQCQRIVNSRIRQHPSLDF